jgi:hypothetical protein
MWPGNSVKVVTKQAIPAGGWTHVSVTYDGSSRASGVRIFLNGTPAAVEVVRDGLWKDIIYGGGEPDLTIGYRFRDAGFKDGSVDDFRVFNRPLSPLEVASVAGKDDYTRAVQSIPGIDGANREALFEFYVATAHQPSADARKVLNAARDEQRKFIEQIPEAMAMKELAQPKKAYVLKRGAYDAHGDEVTADTPHVLPPFPKDAPRNRLGLARWLLDPEHPMMARVTVNRYWQMMFGAGIVETAENFGTTGAQPANIELLDRLARDFIASGWDLKRLLKQMAMSAAYRQPGWSSAGAARNQPSVEGEFIASSVATTSRRLTAEMLRDSALGASGLLCRENRRPSC